MKILDRYIGRSVLYATLLALLVLVSIIFFITLVEELGDVGDGTYGIPQAFAFVALVMPRVIYNVFPIAALIGSLVGLGLLANSHELVAIRAAGVSMRRIVLSVLRAGLLMMLAVFVVGEVIAPYTEQWAQTLRAEARTGKITLRTEYGFWARDGQAFVNIRQILPESRLADISFYEYGDNHRLKLATHADHAYYRGKQWMLQGIRQSEFGDDGVITRKIEQAVWPSDLDPEILRVVVVTPEMLPAWGLYRYVRFLRDNGQDPQTYAVAFWGKVVMPLVLLVMLFVSMPFVCGSLRTITIGQRVFIGVLVGGLFFLFNKASAYVAVVYDLSPLLSAVAPALLVLGAALWLMRRVY